MIVSATHKGEIMHATLSFAYPDDELKLKDALNGGKYRLALEEIQEILEQKGTTMSDKLAEITTQVTTVFEENL